MPAFIVLLRGINVGGRNKLPMKALRDIVEAAGGGDVATYIQSGNVVFSAPKGASAAFEKKISTGIEKTFGFKPDVFVLGQAAFEKVLKNNPFAAECEDASKLHVMFLRQAADRKALRPVEELLANGERIKAVGAALYFDAPEGIGRSKAAEKLVRVSENGTMRNWRTCLKLQEMAQDA